MLEVMDCRYLIAANKKKNKIAISALMPYDTEQSATDLLSGKTEEVDLSDYITYLFMREEARTVTRTDNGVVKAVDEWLPSNIKEGEQWAIADGLDFVYAPLDYGEYSLFFEICDTQGNLYCSEPIDIDTSHMERLEKPEQKTTTVESDGTYPLLLKEDESLAVYLDKGEKDGHEFLTLQVKNKSDKNLEYVTQNLCCNDNISCSDTLPHYGEAPAENAHTSSSDPSEGTQINEMPWEFDFGSAQSSGAVKELTSFRFDLTVAGAEDSKTLWKQETIEVKYKEGSEFKLTPKTSFDHLTLDTELDPVFGAEVKPQTIVDNDVFKAELLCFGTDSGNIKGVYRFINKSEDEDLYLASDGLAIDGIYLEAPEQHTIPPKMIEYSDFSLSDLDKSGITGMQKLQIPFRTGASSTIIRQGYGDIGWYDVKLDKESDSPSKFEPGSKTLMDENGVKVCLSGFEEDKYGGKKWRMTLECDGEEGAELQMTDLDVNGTQFTNGDDQSPVYLYRARTGPGQKCYFDLSVSSYSSIPKEDIKDVSFKFAVFNFTGEKLLFEGKDTVNLEAK